MPKALLAVARSIAAAHDRWRAHLARRHPLSVEVAVLHERVERLQAENDLLRARLRRLEPRRRPRYLPHERLAILWHRARYGLSLSATARAFVVSVQTLVTWAADVALGESRLVRARRAVNALPNLVADLVHRLRREWPRWGTRRIAGVLARLGIAASRTSVQRIPKRPRRCAPAARVVRRVRGPLVPKYAGHMVLIDFTRIGGVFRSFFVGAVIDGFSRKVLALRVCAREPTALFAVRLLREAVGSAGPCRWVISDHGRQFTSAVFRGAVHQLGARCRRGAVGKKGSICLIERLWRSCKSDFARGLVLYRRLPTIERRLGAYALTWFNEHRPHQGLGQRTPDEVHAGRATSATSVPLQAVLEVEHLDGERDLPVLRLRPAA